MRRKQIEKRWFETHEEAKAFAWALPANAWGVEVRKVNKANKRYTHGATVEWYYSDTYQRGRAFDDTYRKETV